MKRLIPCIASAAFAATLSAAALDTSAYAKSLSITVPSTAVAADVELTDFPLLVRLSGDVFDYSAVKLADGADIAFTDAEGASLAYDIDTWNADGESLVWVKIPTFRRGAKVTLWYGADAATANDPTEVWKSRFAGVWHCADASGNLTDATGRGLAAVPTGAKGYADKMTAVEGGAVGACRAAQDSSTYYSGLRSAQVVADSDALHVGSQFVFSGWFKADQVVSYARLVSTKATYESELGWEVQFNDNPRKIALRGAGTGDFEVAIPSCVGRWTHLAFAFDGTTASCYTNGFLTATGSVREVANSTVGLAFGGNANATEHGFDGWFDELRYRSGAVSAAEIEAEYRMVAESDYLTYGEEPATVDISQFAKAIPLTLNAAYAADGVSDAPVLVRLSTAMEGFSYSDFRDANGGDLCIADADGVILPHEIDTWNAAGESLVWVKLPSASAGAKLVVYYGSDTYRADASAETWSDYVGVWHFGEESGTAFDATGHGLDGTPSGDYAEGHNVGIDDGVVGRARKNGGDGVAANKSYISIPDYDSFGLTDTFTASGFFRASGSGGWYRLFSRRGGVAGGWGQEMQWDDMSTMYVYGASGTTSVTIPSIEKTWVHLTFVYQGETCTVYANGEKVGQVEGMSAATANGQPLSFGCTSDGGDWPLCGDYDEIRLTGRVPSAAQVKFEYAAMTAADFFTAGGVISTADAGTPVVSVEKVRDAVEARRVSGVFRISLDRAPAQSIRVNYVLSGSAVGGVDYVNAANGSAVVLPGETFVDVPIEVRHNPKATADRTVELALAEGDGYALGSSSAQSAALTIANLAAPTKYNFRKMVEFRVTAAFLGEEALAGFPVLVRLSSAISGFDYADFKSSDGSDILFTDARGATVYAHEVDEWNVGGESLVWVFVPRLTAGEVFRMYYGSEMDLGGADAGETWPGYAGVWHFNERTCELPARDATGHGLDAAVRAQLYPDYNKDFAEGAVGHARYNMPCSYLDGGRNWYSVPAYDDLAVGAAFAFSGWFRANSPLDGYPRIVSRKTAYESTTGWEVELAHSYTEMNVRGASASGLGVEIPSLLDAWVHLAFVYSEGEGKNYRVAVYTNGFLAAESGSVITPPQDNGLPLSFGNNSTGDEASFNGMFDEMRLRGGTASPNWMRAEYETVRNAAFVGARAVRPAVGGFKLIIR